MTSSGAAAVAAIATAATTSGLQVGVTSQQHQRPVSLTASGNMSPSQTSLQRASTAPAGGAPCNTRITGPQPVDVNMKCILPVLGFPTLSLLMQQDYEQSKTTDK